MHHNHSSSIRRRRFRRNENHESSERSSFGQGVRLFRWLLRRLRSSSCSSSRNHTARMGGGGSSSDGDGSLSSNAFLWLVLWTLNNVGVTLANKAAFSKVDFHYPFFLSAIHMFCNWVGSQYIFYTVRRRTTKHRERTRSDSGNDSTSATAPLSDDSEHSRSKPPAMNHHGSGASAADNHHHPSYSAEFWLTRLLGDHLHRQPLDRSGQRRILAFSVLFSLNVAIGNLSLRHVSVNFNQVLRSLVPALTMLMGMALGQHFSRRRQLALVPIVVGVAMACFGDMSYTATGLFFTILCIVLAALKVVASGQLLTGNSSNNQPQLKLHPVDLLGHMAPLALLQCLCLALAKGEVRDICARWHTELSPWTDFYPFAVVCLSGLLSFTMNISSLQANKLTSPLTLCIAANVKQVFMMMLSTLIFHTEITPLNGTGILVVLVGSARYSYVSVVEKQQQQRASLPMCSSSLSKPATIERTSEDNDEEAPEIMTIPLVDRAVERD